MVLGGRTALLRAYGARMIRGHFGSLGSGLQGLDEGV